MKGNILFNPCVASLLAVKGGLTAMALSYPKEEFVQKLRRWADTIENGECFEIQIAVERIYVPARAIFNIEHERQEGEEEIEFQIKWNREHE